MQKIEIEDFERTRKAVNRDHKDSKPSVVIVDDSGRTLIQPAGLEVPELAPGGYAFRLSVADDEGAEKILAGPYRVEVEGDPVVDAAPGERGGLMGEGMAVYMQARKELEEIRLERERMYEREREREREFYQRERERIDEMHRREVELLKNNNRLVTSMVRSALKDLESLRPVQATVVREEESEDDDGFPGWQEIFQQGFQFMQNFNAMRQQHGERPVQTVSVADLERMMQEEQARHEQAGFDSDNANPENNL